MCWPQTFFDASSCYKSNEKVIHFWQKKLCFPENQHFEKNKWKMKVNKQNFIMNTCHAHSQGLKDDDDRNDM
jgi:hypothetical protein